LMVDQRVSEGKRIPFFNFDAFTTTLPAQIALKYKYDIVPLYIKRLKNNSFEMEVFEPLKISNSTDPEKIKLETSLKINKIIEKMILKDPSQWILTHNRWK
jgi:KDO2-lipid IV(A) lauroyltransferase